MNFLSYGILKWCLWHNIVSDCPTHGYYKLWKFEHDRITANPFLVLILSENWLKFTLFGGGWYTWQQARWHWLVVWRSVSRFFNGSRRGYSGPLDFILSGLVEDISSEGWQNMKSNGHVMTILRSEMWYSSSKIEEYGVARPIWLESEYSE